MRSFGSSNARGRRSVPRTQAPVIAVLSSATGEYFASVTDVSRTGARVEAETLPPLGEQLIFSAVDVQARGGVVRSTADFCAIEFETPIAASEVQRLQSHGSRQQ
jgi:hypothetical protein